MMTNEISVKQMSDAQIMAAIGQTVDTNRPILSRLQINRDAEDDDNNRLPTGHYFIYHPELEQNIYGETVEFRPFYTAYQYMAYNPAEKKYSTRSIVFKNWKPQSLFSITKVDNNNIPNNYNPDPISLSPEFIKEIQSI